jgi:hypothetical protein
MRLGNSTGNLNRAVVWGLLLIAMVFVGCGLRAVPIYRSEVPGSADGLPVVDRNQLLSELRLYEGTPYREGGNTITGIDCSGLVRTVYGALGVRLPRTVLEQYAWGMPVSQGAMQTGDLLFFGRGKPTHVGIAISDRAMMHSSSSRGVVVEDIRAYSDHTTLIGVRRVADLR